LRSFWHKARPQKDVALTPVTYPQPQVPSRPSFTSIRPTFSESLRTRVYSLPALCPELDIPRLFVEH